MNIIGKNIILAKGWDYTIKEYKEAWEKGKLLRAQIETSNVCDLMCKYCFRHETNQNIKTRLPNEITLKETFSIIDQLEKLEVKSIDIVGAGEPMLDLNITKIIKYIIFKNIQLIIFINGYNISDKQIELLDNPNITLIIKVNSFNNKIQDKLVQKIGYTEKRNKTLQKLIKKGFNKPGSDYKTRLGIDSIICKDNINEIEDIFRYCRNNNIMPLITTFIPAGKTKNKNNLEITYKDYINLAKKIKKIDEKEFNIKYNNLTYLGGVPCTQLHPASIYINIKGDAYNCVAQTKYFGNIKEKSIKNIFEQLKVTVKNKELLCPPRIEYWTKTNQL
jgi:MoaA/NifB/PqqE/SkfB family radical SAM enzyme